MSFSHKAFAFSWDSFAAELAPILTRALATEDTSAVEAFITRHLGACSSPYGGQPLGADWRELLESGTTQELADFALTRYYKPTEDFGLGEVWVDVETNLSEPQRSALLGASIGSSGRLFDPGFQGSYFQSPETVQQSVALLAGVEHKNLRQFQQRLQEIAASGEGLYVTF